jgi:uncharacterized protein (TIGR02099 family)
MRPVIRYSVFTLSALLVLAVVLLGTIRLLLPMVGQYRAEIEQQLSVSLGHPLRIGGITGSWEGLSPQLYLKDVSLLSADSAQTLLHLDNVWAGINIPASLWHGRVESSSLKVSGCTLSLLRDPDGRIRLEGFDNKESTTLDRLLNQRRLQLEKSLIAWTDQQLGHPRMEFNVTQLQLKNQPLDGHELSGVVSLDAPTRQELTFDLDFKGDITQPKAWDGQFTAHGIAVQLAPWLDGQAVAGVRIKQGTVNFKLSGAGKDGQLTALEGDATGNELSLTSAIEPTLSIRYARGAVLWQRPKQDWELTVNQFVLQRDTSRSPPSEFKITSKHGPGHVMEASFDQLRLDDVMPLLLISPKLGDRTREGLTATEPHGVVRQVRLRLQSAEPLRTSINVQTSIEARLTDVTVQAWNNFPAVENLTATLQADEEGGALKLDSQASKVFFPKVFREPLEVASAVGELGWQRRGEGWFLSAQDMKLSNADGNVSFRGDLEIPVQPAARRLNLEAQFDNGDASKTGRYLPINILDKDIIEWFDTAMVSGRVTSGTALVHGTIEDFPYANGQGDFEVRFGVKGAVMNYQPGWPQLSQVDAAVVFKGPGLTIQTTAGKFFDAELLEARATVADLSINQPQLKVQGKVLSSGADGLRFIQESPLKEGLAEYLDNVTAQGKGLLDLELVIPLTNDSEQVTQVRGKAALSEARLRLMNATREGHVELSGINGVVNFTEGGLTGEAISATLFGQPTQINLRSVFEDEQKSTLHTTTVEARGNISAPELAKQVRQLQPDIDSLLLERIQGKADWTASLQADTSASGQVVAQLTVKSDLHGMAVDLPEPLKKTAEETVQFTVHTDLKGEGGRQNYQASYGKRLSTVFEVMQSGKTASVQRGAIGFGERAIALPAQGVRIAGALPSFSWDAWKDILNQGGDGQTDFTQQPIGVDLRIGTLQAFAQTFSAVHIKANKTRSDWEVMLESDEVAGTLSLPGSPESVWLMGFTRLHLAKDESDAQHSYDPKQWPALRVTSKSFKYGALDLGELVLESEKRPAGLHVKTLSLTSPVVRLTGQGDWDASGGQQTSHFQLAMQADELGPALGTFAYTADNVKGGKTQLDLSAHWLGAPMDFALDKLNGTLTMDIAKGRFLDLEPGAGRIFGLLSLQTLPRRLLLDFSDVFGEGFAFDNIAGEFTLEDGNAYTNNLVMLGPAAIIHVQGRTGLATQDYDQIVTVQAQIGATLPLVGALAAGAGAGAVILLAQKIFKSKSDEIKGAQYTVTGTWADPIVEPVAQQKPVETIN